MFLVDKLHCPAFLLAVITHPFCLLSFVLNSSEIFLHEFQIPYAINDAELLAVYRCGLYQLPTWLLPCAYWWSILKWKWCKSIWRKIWMRESGIHLRCTTEVWPGMGRIYWVYWPRQRWHPVVENKMKLKVIIDPLLTTTATSTTPSVTGTIYIEYNY